MSNTKSVVLFAFLVALFTVGMASANLLPNGDFEADAGSIVAANAPTGWDWEFPTYGGSSTVSPNTTIDVSGIGDGSGGTVGVLLASWDSNGAWNDGIQAYFAEDNSPQYEVTITWAITGGAITPSTFLHAQMYDVIDNSDPATIWSGGNYATSSDAQAVSYTGNEAQDTWFVDTLTLTSTGTSDTMFMNSAGYGGTLVIGSVEVVGIPEPATLALGMLGVGALLLTRIRRK